MQDGLNAMRVLRVIRLLRIIRFVHQRFERENDCFCYFQLHILCPTPTTSFYLRIHVKHGISFQYLKNTQTLFNQILRNVFLYLKIRNFKPLNRV